MGLGSFFARKKKAGPNKRVVSTMKNLIVFTNSKNFNKTKLSKYSLGNLLYAITAVSGPNNNYRQNNTGVWFVVNNQSNLTKNKLLNNIALAPPQYYKSNLANYQKKNWARYNYFLKQNFPNRK